MMQTSENTAPKLQRDYLLHKRLQRLVGEAVKDFGLIEPEDRILIGLSGGKDSLALLDLMGERMKRSNGYFSLEAVHVRMSNIQYESDTSYLEQKAAAWGVPFHVVETGFEADRNEKRTPCFLCSWNRRKTLFSVAQNLGCTKIALGHHQDDILNTALMNLTFNGSFSTMSVRISMRKFPLTIIRPLARIAESELREWADLKQYMPVKKVCPFDKVSNRTEIQKVTEQMALVNPDYRQNLWHALLKAGALIEE